jgi:hypothetical protein
LFDETQNLYLYKQVFLGQYYFASENYLIWHLHLSKLPILHNSTVIPVPDQVRYDRPGTHGSWNKFRMTILRVQDDRYYNQKGFAYKCVQDGLVRKGWKFRMTLDKLKRLC